MAMIGEVTTISLDVAQQVDITVASPQHRARFVATSKTTLLSGATFVVRRPAIDRTPDGQLNRIDPS